MHVEHEWSCAVNTCSSSSSSGLWRHVVIHTLDLPSAYFSSLPILLSLLLWSSGLGFWVRKTNGCSYQSNAAHKNTILEWQQVIFVYDKIKQANFPCFSELSSCVHSNVIIKSKSAEPVVSYSGEPYGLHVTVPSVDWKIYKKKSPFSAI